MKIFSIKNFFGLGLAIFCLFFASANFVSAQTLDAGKLRIEYDGTGALFNETNIVPGFEAVKTITITNTGNVAHSFSIAVLGQLGKLAEVLQIEPRNFETGTPIWNKTVQNIAKAPDSDVILGSIASGQVRKVNIAAILPSEVGNDYQATSTFAFDFVIGNESTDLSEATTDQNNNTGSTVRSIDIKNIVTIARNTNTSIAVAPVIADANVPVANENAVALTSLNEQGGVAGASTENKNICFWWWILLIILAVILTAYGILSKKHRGWFFLIWPSFFGAFIYVIHWILHSYYTPSKWCDWWFAGILLFEIILYYIIKSRTNKK